MSPNAPSPDERQTEPAVIPPVRFEARSNFARHLLRGHGLEIGALHRALPLSRKAKASYVDRMPTDELRREYPELAEFDLVDVDIVDDGERLDTVADESQDFIIANHFLEHCEDPIGTITVHLNKLTPGGALFYAVPDKRYTFDFRRPATPLDHMVSDHKDGPADSRMDHYLEWAGLVEPGSGDEAAIRSAAERFEADSYSIHMHVWTQAEFLQLIIRCREIADEAFDIEAAARRGHEFIVVLRKQGEKEASGAREIAIAAATRVGKLMPKPLRRPLRRAADRRGLV